MLPLKEFADFVTLNMANLAATYAQLLAEREAGQESFPAIVREASARKALRAVVETFTLGKADPLILHFKARVDHHQPWSESAYDTGPLVEIECLAQTLSPVVTNLEAGKFLWRVLSDVRYATMPTLERIVSIPTGESAKRSNGDFEQQATKAAKERIRMLINLEASAAT
ncbi:MAG: hypothetical protein OES12_11050 [Anaerolineae bacterium]|nr:hypothetical protein [Anaerolineae bacterium]